MVRFNKELFLRKNMHKFFFFALLLVAKPLLAAPGDNVARTTMGGIATQSSFFNNNWPASNCINGITASNLNSQLCHSKRNSDTNEWWDVKLPASVPIDRVVIHNRTNCCTDRILGLYVLVSDAPFPIGSDAASLSAARVQASFEYLITADATVTDIAVGNLVGEYVRIQKSGVGLNVNSAINLLEIEVFEGSGVDLSIAKSASDTTPNVGDVITFTLTVNNTGPVDATNFIVNDVVPPGFGGITGISHGGTINTSNEVEWLISSLPGGESMELIFQAIVLSP